jgi:LPXTG-motif cell wall-anchored protein
MQVKRSVVFVMVAVIVAAAGFVAAQTTTSLEIKRGTVVSVWGNDLVVKMMDGETRHVEVPEGFTFNVEGKQLPVSALKPGMNLTAVIKTTSEPITVKTTEVKQGKVLEASGRTVIIRGPDGAKKYTVPGDMPFIVNGEEKTVYELRKGMNVTAHIVHTHVETVTMTERQVAAAEPVKAKPAPVAAPAAPKAAAPAPVLPKTGSSLPLAGLLGVLLLAIGTGIGIIRRF